MRECFTFYRSFMEATELLDDATFRRLMEAVFHYSLDDTDPNLTGLEKSVFLSWKPVIDASNRRRDASATNGKKGGRPPKHPEAKTLEKPKQNLAETKAKPTETSNVKEKKKDKTEEEIDEIIDYLNKVCGTRYKASTEATRKSVRARIGEGYTVEDFKKVIDKKYKEWHGTEFEQYLTPQTLFRPSKFEVYVNQTVRDKSENDFGRGMIRRLQQF